MFALYKKELEGKEVHEVAGEGFAVYSFPKEKPDTVYIEDIFVVPEKRRTRAGTKIADTICVTAKARGCTKLLGSVNLQHPKLPESVAALSAYGMEYKGVTTERKFLIFEKDL